MAICLVLNIIYINFQVRNQDVVALISELLKVKYETLLAALTSKRVKASGETLIMQYKLPDAIAIPYPSDCSQQ